MTRMLDAGDVRDAHVWESVVRTHNLIGWVERYSGPLSVSQKLRMWESTVWSVAGWLREWDAMEGKTIPAVREAPSADLRRQVLERDGFACRACGGVDTGVPMHVDHVLPVAFGGETVLDNLQTLCASCNLSKGVDAVRYAG